MVVTGATRGGEGAVTAMPRPRGAMTAAPRPGGVALGPRVVPTASTAREGHAGRECLPVPAPDEAAGREVLPALQPVVEKTRRFFFLAVQTSGKKGNRNEQIWEERCVTNGNDR